MKMTQTKLAGCKQRLTATARSRGQFLSPTYCLNGRTLHHVAACPSAWMRRGCEHDQQVNPLSEAVWALLTNPEHAERHMAVRPEMVKSTLRVCPKCGSAGPAKTCRECGLERHQVLREVKWTKQRADCRAWEERAEATGRVLISTPDWQRAKQAAECLTLPPAMASLLKESQLGVTVTGVLTTETGQAVRVHELILALPNEDSVHSDAIYLLQTLTQTAHGTAEGTMDWKGDAARGALALDLVNRATNGVRTKVRFLVAGLGLDPEPAFCELSQSAIQAGRHDYESGAIKYLAGIHDQVWPGHDHDGAGNISWRIVDSRM